MGFVTWLLTTGVDNLIGTDANDTFNAVQTSASVFGGLDVIDGKGGTDTLNIQDTATTSSGTFSLNGATIKNIEVMQLVTSGDIANLDLSGISTLTTASLTANGSGNSTGIKLNGNTDATIVAQNGNVSVADGGKSLNITAAGAATIDVGSSTAQNTTATSLTLKTGTGTVKVYGSALTDVTVNGGGAVTVDNTDSTGTTGAGTTLTTVTLNNDAGATLKGKGIGTVALANQGKGGTAQTITISNSTASHALTIKANGTGYTTAGVKKATKVTDLAATTLTVDTTAKSAIDASGSTAVTSVVLSGAGDLDFAPMGATVTSIDGSSATGSLTLGTLNAAAKTVKTGSGNDTFTFSATAKGTIDTGAGNDTVTLASALAAGSTVTLGDGNDKLLKTTGSVAASTSTATTTIDAGAGDDVLSADLVTAGNAAQFLNFEKLNLDSLTGLDVGLLSGNNTLSGLAINGATTDATYQNVSKAWGLSVETATNNSAKTNTLQFSDASGSNDEYSIAFTANGGTTAPTAANTQAGTLVAGGIETFNIASGGTNAWNSIALGTDAEAQKVVITGDANLDLTFSSFGSTTSPNTGVSLIDGSAATGKLNINTSGINAATAGLTVKGGSADDTITLATGQKATVDAGAGNDSITLAATGGTVTTGAGNDTVDVTAASAGSTTAPVISVITDAAAGDKLLLVNRGSEVFTATKVDVSTATALYGGTTNALDLAATADGSTNAQIKWFQYGGDTYVVEDLSAANTFATSDLVVKITGLVDLSTATLGGTNGNELTLA